MGSLKWIVISVIAVVVAIGFGVAIFSLGGTQTLTGNVIRNITDGVAPKDGVQGSNGTSLTSPISAVDDMAFITTEDHAVVIPVLVNDKGDGNLIVQSVSDPTKGSVVINANGSVTYTLDDANFVGDDTFSYIVYDGKNATDTAQVTVTVQKPGSSGELPIADAGPSRTIDEGSLVILKGTASSDPDGDPLTYSWKQIWGPTVDLSNPTSVTPNFTSPEIDTDSVELTFELTVSDGNSGEDSDTVDVTVRNVIGNQPPEADAGSDQTVNEGSVVTLEGIASSDPDGDELTYSWSQIDGETIESISTTSPNPTFTAPNIDPPSTSTTLTFELTVDDGNGGSDSDTVVIVIQDEDVNQPPVADAGLSQTVEQDTSVTLSGLESSDPDGDPLSFSWNQTAGPSVSLSNSTSSSPTFTAPEVTEMETLTFELTVSDGNQSSVDSVNIHVNPADSPQVILSTPDYMNDVAGEIRNAQQSVYAAMYFAEPYSGNIIVDELKAAVERGVDVRLTFDNETLDLYPNVEQDFTSSGIPYKVVSNHAKVVVIDNATAYVGSANWNKNGLQNNWELSLKTKNPDTVKEAYEYVDILWEKGAKKVNNSEKPSERFANGIEFYNLLLDRLKTAQSVKVLMFQITYNAEDPEAADTKMLNVIKDANNRGANLQILLDDPTYYGRDGGRYFLSGNNIPHKLDEKNTGYLERLHAKTVLIDDRVLFIGSQNWNYDSLDSPQEASIMTTDPQAISEFLALFDEKWNAGREPV